MAATKNSLSGIRVLDFGGSAGVLAGRALADLGADVILVEPPTGSSLRHLAPFVDNTNSNERSYRHLYLNANKRSVVLDAATSVGITTLHYLIKHSDIIIDAAPASVLLDLGLQHKTLVALQPTLIHIDITPFHPQSNSAHHVGTDLTACAAGGLLQVTGEASGPPCHDSSEPSYTLASLTAVAATLTALHATNDKRSPSSQHIQISLQECAAFASSQTANPNAFQRLQEVPCRPGVSQALRCADGGYVTLLAVPMHVERLIEFLNAAGVQHEITPTNHMDYFATPIWTMLNSPMHQRIAEAALNYPREEFLTRFAETGCHAMPILSFDEMRNTPHYQQTEPFVQHTHDHLQQQFEMPRSILSAVRQGLNIQRAPLLGEHTQDVIGELPPQDSTPSKPTNVKPKSKAGDPLKSLVGLKVLDFTWVIAGPLTTQQLATYGAEVIKVESQHRIDSLRLYVNDDNSFDFDLGDMFNIANTGKKSLNVNLGTPGGREVVQKLLQWADVVVNNFSAGAFARMGYDYASLKRWRKDIILLHLPGVGGTGPWANKGTFGPMLSALTGMNHLVGFAEQPPRGIGVALPDFTSPLVGATCILAALRHRAATGEGQEIELSQLGATLALIGAQWMEFAHTGKMPTRPGNRNPNYAPHGVYPCQGNDAWCAIAVQTDLEFGSLAKLMEQPELVLNPDYADAASRQHNQNTLDALVSGWTKNQDKWALAKSLQNHGLAGEAVASIKDLLAANSSLSYWFEQVRQPSRPTTPLVAEHDALSINGQRPALQRAPMLGEHNNQILMQILGYTEAQIQELQQAEALQ